MSLLPTASIADIARHEGQSVALAGWVAHRTEKGKLVFIRLRDGSGVIQCVVFKKNVSEDVFAAAQQLTQESSCRITGFVRADARAPGGYELDVSDVQIVQIAPDHADPAQGARRRVSDGASPPVGALVQAACAAALRAEIVAAAQEWLNAQGFVRFDTAPPDCHGSRGRTSNLFATE